MKKKQIITVLVVDGGGMFGIIPAQLLSELEARTGRPVAKLFDLKVGTSTGAMIVVGLSVPGKNNNPKYSAKRIINIYETYGSKIFSTTFCILLKRFGD